MSLAGKEAKWVYVTCMVAAFLVPFMMGALNMVVPAIGLEFRCSQYLLNWVVASFLLVAGSLMLPMGKLADLAGRVPIFKAGLLLFFLATVACAMAPGVRWIILFRAVQGVGAAMLFSTVMALLTSIVPPQERGKALGIFTAIVYFAQSVGPILGGVICSWFGWRGIFAFLAIVALAVMVMAFAKLHGPWAKPDLDKLDPAGGMLCVSGLVLFLYGSSSLAMAPVYWVLALLGVALLWIFVIHEKRIPFPLLSVELFTRNRVFAFSNLASVINYSSVFAMPFMLSLYLQTVRGVPLKSAGLILLVQPVVMAALSPIVGRLSDRMDARLLSSLGMGVNTLGLLFFVFLGQGTALPLVMGNLAFIGLGYALFSTPNNNAIMGAVDRSQYGLASSALGTSRVVGQALSMAIVSLITTHFIGPWTIGTSGYGGRFMAGLAVTFMVFALLNFLGVFASLARGAAREG